MLWWSPKHHVTELFLSSLKKLAKFGKYPYLHLWRTCIYSNVHLDQGRCWNKVLQLYKKPARKQSVTAASSVYCLPTTLSFNPDPPAPPPWPFLNSKKTQTTLIYTVSFCRQKEKQWSRRWKSKVIGKGSSSLWQATIWKNVLFYIAFVELNDFILKHLYIYTCVYIYIYIEKTQNNLVLSPTYIYISIRKHRLP